LSDGSGNARNENVIIFPYHQRKPARNPKYQNHHFDCIQPHLLALPRRCRITAAVRVVAVTMAMAVPRGGADGARAPGAPWRTAVP